MVTPAFTIGYRRLHGLYKATNADIINGNRMRAHRAAFWCVGHQSFDALGDSLFCAAYPGHQCGFRLIKTNVLRKH